MALTGSPDGPVMSRIAWKTWKMSECASIRYTVPVALPGGITIRQRRTQDDRGVGEDHRADVGREASRTGARVSPAGTGRHILPCGAKQAEPETKDVQDRAAGRRT